MNKSVKQALQKCSLPDDDNMKELLSKAYENMEELSTNPDYFIDQRLSNLEDTWNRTAGLPISGELDVWAELFVRAALVGDKQILLSIVEHFQSRLNQIKQRHEVTAGNWEYALNSVWIGEHPTEFVECVGHIKEAFLKDKQHKAGSTTPA